MRSRIKVPHLGKVATDFRAITWGRLALPVWHWFENCSITWGRLALPTWHWFESCSITWGRLLLISGKPLGEGWHCQLGTALRIAQSLGEGWHWFESCSITWGRWLPISGKSLGEGWYCQLGTDLRVAQSLGKGWHWFEKNHMGKVGKVNLAVNQGMLNHLGIVLIDENVYYLIFITYRK